MPYCLIISTDQNFILLTADFVKKKSYLIPLNIQLRNEYSDPIDLYKCLSDKISKIPFTELRESVVLVDEYLNLRKCQPIDIIVNCDVFWGRMILAFPELEFVFLNKTVESSKTIIDWIENESSTKHRAFLPLFDYSGLRSGIRNLINKSFLTKENINKSSQQEDGNDETGQKTKNSGLKLRINKARVIEDELSYAYFHAYIVYKWDHRCKLYTTLNHLEQDQEELSSKINIQIRDWSLGFVDKRTDCQLSEDQLFDKFKFLKVDQKKDFIITVGKKENDHLSENQLLEKFKYLLKYSHSKKDGDQTVIYKPTKGMYEIGELLGISIKDEKDESSSDETSYAGTHCAPGMLAFIAENLISRAQNILDNARQVTDAIHAAVLSLEAKELLNGLTPTLAFQAFAIQQKAEVTAECLFIGTEYNIELKDRFKDIRKEVQNISKRFKATERNRVQLNTELSIAETLSGVYGHYKQFEEELKCLNKAREINFELKFKIKPLWKVIAWTMRSSRNFIIGLLGLQLFFSLFYYLLLKNYEKSSQWDLSWSGFLSEIKTIGFSIISSIKYFFTTETNKTFQPVFDNNEFWSTILLGFQGFFSLTSLSIFMAMIYLRISRK